MMEYSKGEENLYFSIVDTSVRESIKRQLALLVDLITMQQTDAFADIKKNQVVLELFYLLLSGCRVTKPKESRYVKAGTAYAKHLLEYIEEHYAEELSLDSLAKEVGLSSQYLSKHFKQATNMGVVQYINLIRLEHANQELLNEDVTVMEAAMNNGFASVKAYIAGVNRLLRD